MCGGEWSIVAAFTTQTSKYRDVILMQIGRGITSFTPLRLTTGPKWVIAGLKKCGLFAPRTDGNLDIPCFGQREG